MKVFLSLHLFASIASLAAPHTDPAPSLRGSESSCLPTTIPHLPLDVFETISRHSSYAFASSTAFIYHRCRHVLSEKALEFFIGQTPTFLPTVKRCMLIDSVECYTAVKHHFEMLNSLDDLEKGQVFALAAQLGALRIFRNLSVSSSDPRWKSWMTRAALQKRYKFLKEIGQIDLKTLVNRGDEQEPRTSLHYEEAAHFLDADILGLNANHLVENDDTPPLPRVSDDHQAVLRLYSITRKKRKHRWIDSALFSEANFPYTPKRIYQIFALKPELRDRELRVLQAYIHTELTKGVYIMDDLIGSTTYMLVLWWHYGPQGADNRSAWFLEWVLTKGAPVDDTALLNDYHQLSYSNRLKPELVNRYIRMLEMAIKYRFGSKISSLRWHLRHPNLMSIQKTLNIFADKLRVNIRDPLVLMTSVEVISQISGSNSLGLNRAKRRELVPDLIKIYKQQGLSMDDIQLVQTKLQNKYGVHIPSPVLRILELVSDAVSPNTTDS